MGNKMTQMQSALNAINQEESKFAMVEKEQSILDSMSAIGSIDGKQGIPGYNTYLYLSKRLRELHGESEENGKEKKQTYLPWHKV